MKLLSFSLKMNNTNFCYWSKNRQKMIFILNNTKMRIQKNKKREMLFITFFLPPDFKIWRRLLPEIEKPPDCCRQISCPLLNLIFWQILDLMINFRVNLLWKWEIVFPEFQVTNDNFRNFTKMRFWTVVSNFPKINF